MKVLTKEHVIYSFNQKNPARYRVEDGETFWVETDDCYSGKIKDESVKRPDIDISIMDCSVGPIYIEGAHPGDTLCVEILAIQFAPQGVMVTSKGLGVLGERIQEPDTKIIPIRDGFAYFSESIRLPLTPMVGVCGVAPKAGRPRRKPGYEAGHGGVPPVPSGGAGGGRAGRRRPARMYGGWGVERNWDRDPGAHLPADLCAP